MTPVELKARREALGLSLKALGEVWGVRPQSITSWEEGFKAPRDWSWVTASISAMEDYQDDLTDQMITTGKETHADTGEAALITYDSRGSFYRWHPDAREKEWPGGGQSVPVELYRTAAARAGRQLRRLYGEEAVSLVEVPSAG